MRKQGALVYPAMYPAMPELDREVDDEIDLLADTEEDICPTCGSLLVEYGEDFDFLFLHCPVCDRQFR